MPIRSSSQRCGKGGERAVEDLFDAHLRWVPRRQDEDFGIDLEVELADPVDGKQELRGQLLKVQVKTQQRFRRADSHLLISLKRRWIHYACAFRVPVILAAVELESRKVWWLWLQEWAILHEAAIVPRWRQMAESDRRSKCNGVLCGVNIPIYP